MHASPSALGTYERLALLIYWRRMSIKKKTQRLPPTKPQTLLTQLAANPDKLFTGSFRQQYAALCFRYEGKQQNLQILVLTSRDSGRWIIPKGWPMKKKKPHEAAKTEAWEEAGIKGKIKKEPIGRYTYLKLFDDGDVAPTIVDVFQLLVTEQTGDYKEKGQRILAWVSPEEAARRVRELELKSLLVDFKPRA